MMSSSKSPMSDRLQQLRFMRRGLEKKESQIVSSRKRSKVFEVDGVRWRVSDYGAYVMDASAPESESTLWSRPCCHGVSVGRYSFGGANKVIETWMSVLLDSSHDHAISKKEQPDEAEGMTGEELAQRWAKYVRPRMESGSKKKTGAMEKRKKRKVSQ
eukprot:TRINITY_DN2440_c0_g1_i1.p1 TRINITY_DN2440_c0_g1~~TRINITY_DN2440_c0_g1_i1.p1  ORF type:complete len:158 (-),score=47.92 TRINITY_DN2440_c0_g1_i1:743-1216(-)